MLELLKTDNPILVSWLRSILQDIGIEGVIFDEFTSFLGGLSYAIPFRVMVSSEDFYLAHVTLENAMTEVEMDVGDYEISE